MGAELTCGGKALKSLVFLFNFLAFVAGIAILGGCLAARFFDPVTEHLMQSEQIRELVRNDNTNLHILLYAGMIIGGVLCILGFLGCCGALLENCCMLGTFAVILIIMILCQLAIGIMVLVHKDKVNEPTKKALDKLIDEFVKNDQKPRSERETACKFLAEIQPKLECCGRGDKAEIKSNCVDTLGVNDAECKFDASCETVIVDKIKKYGMIAGIIAIAFIVFEITAVIFACCLCRAIKNGSVEDSYDDDY